MTVPAGWYINTSEPTEQRYWDGEQWSGHTAPPPLFDSATTPSRRRQNGQLIGVLVGSLLVIIAATIYSTVYLPRHFQTRTVNTVFVVSDMGQLALALDQYHNIHHAYPRSLSELTAAPAVPFSRTQGNELTITTDGTSGYCIYGMSPDSDYWRLAKLYDSSEGIFRPKGTPCSVNYPYRFTLPQ